MAGGKDGWMKPGGYPELELGGLQPVDLGDGTVQLRFDSVAVPGTDVRVVPVLNLTRGDLASLGELMRRKASEVPTSSARN